MLVCLFGCLMVCLVVLVVIALRNFYFFDRKVYKLNHEIVVCRLV